MSGVVQLLLGANDRTSLLQAGSLSYTKSINQRWAANFTLLDPTQAFRPAVGQPFTLNEDGTTVFTGFIDQITEYALDGQTPSNASASVYYQCTCSSWASVLDHRVVVQKYTANIANVIINDIITNFVTGDGITTGGVNGHVLVEQSLDYSSGQSVASAFDQIRDITGEQWWVDENKVLNTVAIGSGTVAGFTVTGAIGDWKIGSPYQPFKVATTSKDFRNVQYIKTTVGLTTVSRTFAFTVKTSLDWWAFTPFVINSAPTVTINGVAQKVYERGVDPFFLDGWYWTPGLNGVQQGRQIAPPIGTVILITYGTFSAAEISASDPASITARAAIEGTSGKWENVLNVPNIGTADIAQQLAEGLLARSSTIPQVLTFQTYRNNYVIGQRVQVIVPMHGLNGYYTVQSIGAKHTPGMVDEQFGKSFLYTITLSNAQDIGNYVKWFEGLLSTIGSLASAVTAAANTPPSPSPGSSGAGTGGIWVREVPSGTKNGSNVTFTTTYVPSPQIAFWLVVNGVLQSPFIDGGPATDFSLSGSTITMTVAPKSTDQMWVIYLRAGTGTLGTSGTGQARQFGNPASGNTGGFASAKGTFAVFPAVSSIGTFHLASMTNGDTVTVGSQTYTFVTSINNAVANQILASPTNGFNLAHALVNAINGLGFGKGVQYSSATVPNPDVVVTWNGDTTLTVSILISPSVDPATLASSNSAGFTWDQSSIGNGIMNDGDTITIGSKTYTFKTTLNNAVANQVLRKPVSGVSVIDFLAAAINGGTGSGTYYSSATVASTQVQGSSDNLNEKLIVTAIANGTAGNSIAVSTSSGGRFTWDGGATTLSGGAGGGSATRTDVVDYGNSSVFNLSGDMALGIWVKFPSNAAGQFIVYGLNGSSAMSENTAFALAVVGSSGAWNVEYGHDHGNSGVLDCDHTFSTALANDKWNYVGFTRDATAKTVTLYIWDGTTMTVPAAFTYPTNHDGGGASTDHMMVGNDPSGILTGDFQPFIGYAEEHYIWSRKLTQAEHQNAAQGNPPLDSMILGCVMGNSPEVDISGNGHSGTVTGTVLVQGH